MKLIFALGFLLCAVAIAAAAMRQLRLRQARAEIPLPAVHALLPTVGDPGSVAAEQIGRLRQAGLDQFDLARLSSQQAPILLNAAKYLEDVWEQEFKKDRTELPRAARDKALEWVLRHESFIERAVVFGGGP